MGLAVDGSIVVFIIIRADLRDAFLRHFASPIKSSGNSATAAASSASVFSSRARRPAPAGPRALSVSPPRFVCVAFADMI